MTMTTKMYRYAMDLLCNIHASLDFPLASLLFVQIYIFFWRYFCCCRYMVRCLYLNATVELFCIFHLISKFDFIKYFFSLYLYHRILWLILGLRSIMTDIFFCPFLFIPCKYLLQPLIRRKRKEKSFFDMPDENLQKSNEMNNNFG